MSYEVQTYEGYVDITKLQGIVTRELKKQGIMIENGIRIYSKTLGKCIELDSLIREDWIVIEYWHSKDKGYRATKKGQLRIPQFKKDVAKTRCYLTELGLFPLWIDQAKYNPNTIKWTDEVLNTIIAFIQEIRKNKKIVLEFEWILNDTFGLSINFIPVEWLRFDYGFELGVYPTNYPNTNQLNAFKLPIVKPEELAKLVKPR